MPQDANPAGKSSMEIGVRVVAEDLVSGKITHTASAYLTFVALGEDARPQPIVSLKLTTDEDKRRNAEALIRRETRLRQKSIVKRCTPRKDQNT